MKFNNASKVHRNFRLISFLNIQLENLTFTKSFIYQHLTGAIRTRKDFLKYVIIVDLNKTMAFFFFKSIKRL